MFIVFAFLIPSAFPRAWDRQTSTDVRLHYLALTCTPNNLSAPIARLRSSSPLATVSRVHPNGVRCLDCHLSVLQRPPTSALGAGAYPLFRPDLRRWDQYCSGTGPVPRSLPGAPRSPSASTSQYSTCHTNSRLLRNSLLAKPARFTIQIRSVPLLDTMAPPFPSPLSLPLSLFFALSNYETYHSNSWTEIQACAPPAACGTSCPCLSYRSTPARNTQTD